MKANGDLLISKKKKKKKADGVPDFLQRQLCIFKFNSMFHCFALLVPIKQVSMLMDS